MSADMLRTTVYIDEKTEAELRLLARRQDRTKAELIREALEAYVAKARAKLEVELPPGVGRYASSRDDVSERADVFLWVDRSDEA
jgi:Ribbon-helix-helix protein, copG family